MKTLISESVMALEPAPLRLRPSRPQRPQRESSYPAIDSEKLGSSLLAGLGIAASISVASVMQFLYPALRLGNLPVAAVLGLLLGWTVAWPVAGVLRRVLDASRMGWVVTAAAASGMVLALPAYFCAHSVGWNGSPIALLVLGLLLGTSGLVWGGYLDFDNPSDF